MEEENITSDSLVDESQLNSATEDETVGNVDQGSASNNEAITLAEINSHLGKNFKDKDTALKSFKDTLSYVGKKKDDIANEIKSQMSSDKKTAELSRELKEIRKDLFFRDNPQYAPYRATIDKLGSDPSIVVNSEEFKPLFEKASGYDESQKLKTVLESSPRIAFSRDSLQKAKEMRNSGASIDDVSTLVARAVLETEQ